MLIEVMNIVWVITTPTLWGHIKGYITILHSSKYS